MYPPSLEDCSRRGRESASIATIQVSCSSFLPPQSRVMTQGSACNYVSTVTRWNICEPNLSGAIDVQSLALECQSSSSVPRLSQPAECSFFSMLPQRIQTVIVGKSLLTSTLGPRRKPGQLATPQDILVGCFESRPERLGSGLWSSRGRSAKTGSCLWRIRQSRVALMVKKLIFASKGGEFPRPKAHAASRS